ncbi:hypothetical protein B0J13DRAFT_542196 [Dactylonectria estremocensis]|uniref:Uncharacterized protein n=1 Tax=Dactylonectria estremocensis TaxID=1079267 RepID=A0A9P9FC21_9HYPO|nr:hypothetical protein B0J13DRAFT_542196 [Dactylonectria estremocensis]
MLLSLSHPSFTHCCPPPWPHTLQHTHSHSLSPTPTFPPTLGFTTSRPPRPPRPPKMYRAELAVLPLSRCYNSVGTPPSLYFVPAPARDQLPPSSSLLPLICASFSSCRQPPAACHLPSAAPRPVLAPCHRPFPEIWRTEQTRRDPTSNPNPRIYTYTYTTHQPSNTTRRRLQTHFLNLRHPVSSTFPFEFLRARPRSATSWACWLLLHSHCRRLIPALSRAVVGLHGVARRALESRNSRPPLP